MENITKIDIIKNEIHCYNELTNERVSYPITAEYDFFISHFVDTQDLLTINILAPITRIMKFYSIKNSIPESFVEIEYQYMSETEKEIFDSFVNIIKFK